jgi:tetratricopeptide (TPR) repeat protein
MRKNIALVLSLVLLLAGVSACKAAAEDAPAASPEQLFRQGNEYYDKGEYARSAQEYEKIRAEGHESGMLYFNLGNAYFKAGRLGEAVLNYKRAKRFLPRDADLNANLRFARDKMKGKQFRGKGIWTWKPLRMYCWSLTVNELLWISSGIYLFIVILLFAAVVFPGKKRPIMAITVIVAVMLLVNSAIALRKIDLERKAAVVIAPGVDAKYAPFDKATKFFNLSEGMSVLVLGEKEGWYKVKRMDGKIGWVKSDQIERMR